jgi:hypothetical protein
MYVHVPRSVIRSIIRYVHVPRSVLRSIIRYVRGWYMHVLRYVHVPRYMHVPASNVCTYLQSLNVL